ncbi:hypothetical protein MMC28_004841 [Mycoblastus sanguinarius]|nr:hypothetical protein [Mycoblastus sanguinarius]
MHFPSTTLPILLCTLLALLTVASAEPVPHPLLLPRQTGSTSSTASASTPASSNEAAGSGASSGGSGANGDGAGGAAASIASVTPSASTVSSKSGARATGEAIMWAPFVGAGAVGCVVGLM